VLKWHRFVEEALYILKSGGQLQHFLCYPSEDPSEVAKRGCNQEETAIKAHHAEESLQLLNILRGGTRVDCGSVLGHRSQTRCQNCVPEKFQSWNGKYTYVQIDGKEGQPGQKKMLPGE
jgi:hypothetical protein